MTARFNHVNIAVKGCVTMADIKCFNCGKVIQDWYKRCPFCHTELSYTTVEELSCSIDEANEDNSDNQMPENDKSANTHKRLCTESQVDELLSKARNIDNNLDTIRKYIKFFVVITVIALIIHFISLCVSCHAGCEVAKELNNFLYSFIPHV